MCISIHSKAFALKLAELKILNAIADAFNE